MTIDMSGLGITDTESKVYLALLELGKSKAGEITKQSRINRTNVYDALERLIEKGLVSYVTENNTRYFIAVSPDGLKDILKERQQKLEDSIDELKRRYAAPAPAIDAMIFRGKKGLKSVYEDILREGQDLYAYGGEGKFGELFPYYFKHWHTERLRLGINIRMIFSERVRGKGRESLKQLQLRFLPESYEFPSMIILYADKVVTIVWTEIPFAFMIKSREAMQSNRNYFEMLWALAVK